MKTKLVFLALFSISFNVLSQETFYVRINCESTIICGDSIVLESALVTPVNLKTELFYGTEDIFEFQIVDMGSNEIIEYHLININVSLDTTLFLKPGNYIFQWVGGCANCTNPEIEGQITDWRLGENVMVECDFKVDSLVNPDSISYSWMPLNSDTNKIKIAPNETTTFKVIAEHTNGNTATDSIQILVPSQQTNV